MKKQLFGITKSRLLSDNLSLSKIRLFLLVFLFLAIFILLLTRLAHLQLIQGAYYRRLADANRYFRQQILAQRGVFLDRYLQPLVHNTKIYFENETDGLFPKKNRISYQTALELMIEDDRRVSFELRRDYLYPWELSHTLGYQAPVTAEELLANKQLKVNEWVGKMGLERQYDQVLRGKDGNRKYEVNTLGEKKRLIDEVLPIAGQDIKTSLDPYLSKIAYEALEQMMGSVVILDADTGQVLVLVNKPSFNANDFTNSFLDEFLEIQRKANLQKYFQDERKVFFNRAISGVYPPGSVFKLVTATAGLEVGAFDENKTVLDEGILKVGDYEYANWLYTQRGATDGEISLVRAIARSNDIFFYKAAEWTGPSNLARQAREFGFGEITGIELAGEAAGLVPDPTWKEQTTGERWFLGNTYHFGIGQGDMATTPLQAIQMVQALTKGGELCQPRLVVDDGKHQWSAQNCRNLGLQEKSVELVLRGMISVCQPGGTGSLLFKYNKDFTPVSEVENAFELLDAGAVGCKTGTSEFGGQDERNRRKTHGWFVANTTITQAKIEENLENKIALLEAGDAESDNRSLSVKELQAWLNGVREHGFPKRLSMVVLVESDGVIPFKEGSRDAAPVVDAIFQYLK